MIAWIIAFCPLIFLAFLGGEVDDAERETMTAKEQYEEYLRLKEEEED